MNPELALQIVLQKPPAGVDFGLQKGSGNKYEAVHIQRSNGSDLFFDLTITVKGDKLKDKSPDFKGSFVQGPIAGRFIYIDIGEFAGQVGGWSMRLKIPLAGITWELTDQAFCNSKANLETHVPGTGKNGAPNCATVKPFEGWKVKF